MNRLFHFENIDSKEKSLTFRKIGGPIYVNCALVSRARIQNCFYFKVKNQYFSPMNIWLNIVFLLAELCWTKRFFNLFIRLFSGCLRGCFEGRRSRILPSNFSIIMEPRPVMVWLLLFYSSFHPLLVSSSSATIIDVHNDSRKFWNPFSWVKEF